MMTWFPVLKIVTLVVLFSKPIFSVSLRPPNPNFPAEAGNSLLGDAHFESGGYSVQLGRPTPSSSGILLRNPPFKFSSSTSFAANFTFEIGNGVALVIIPADFPFKFAGNMSFDLLAINRFVGIEFDVDVCKIVSSRVSNVSKSNHVLKSGVRLSSSIDYHSSLKRIDVRVSKSGDPMPVEPLISYRIDLGEMWKGEAVSLGLASFDGNPEKITSLYSWSFEIKDVPKWLHSDPVNPQEYSAVSDDVRTSKKRGGFLSGFVFATGCGAMAALALFFVWSYFADRQKIQKEPSMSSADFKYEKISVLTVNNREADVK